MEALDTKCCMEERKEEGRKVVVVEEEDILLDAAGLVMGEGVAQMGEIMGWCWWLGTVGPKKEKKVCRI